MANFKGPQYNYIVASDSVVAAGIVLDAGVLSFGTAAASASKICQFKDLIPLRTRVDVAVAEQLQISTVTFTAANSTDYTLLIEQWDPVNLVTISRYYSYTSLASGDTATTIGDAFRTAINADVRIKVAATGTTTLVLTAETGYPIFTVTSIEPATTTIALTGGGNQVGIYAENTYAALTNEGISGVAAGASYTRVHLEYNATGTPTNKVQTNQPYVLDIFVNQAAGDYANVYAKWRYILMGRHTSVGYPDANPETIAVI